MVSSVGRTLTFLLTLVRFPFAMLVDLVTARAPCPPASTGLPTPSLSCVSFALRFRLEDAAVVEATVAEEYSDCASSPVSCTTTLEPDVPRVRVPLVVLVLLEVLERVETLRGIMVGGGAGAGAGVG